MIDINLIRQNSDFVADQLKKRGTVVDFSAVLKLDMQKRKLKTQMEEARAERNRASAEIAKTKKQGGNADEMVSAMQKLGITIADIEKKLSECENKIFDILAALPNIPLPEVQAGGKEENRVVKTFGQKPKFDFKPKDHVELCTSLGLVDYERAAKISGAGTWVYTGLGAQLEWALLNYFVDFHVKNGYTFIMPPHLLNYQSGYAAGQFPKFAEDVFITDLDKDPKKSRFLLPTAETALINLHRDEIIAGDKLPIKYAGYSPCYRKEAGSYRTSERGMIRGYQFNKIEMFVFCKSEDSPALFEELVRNAEKLVEGLGLHYQTVALAAGDMSAAMAKTYDIEVYIPSMAGSSDNPGGYKEVSSCSNATDYQARRAGIRTKVMRHECGADGCKMIASNEYVHTLNASGLATSRLIPAIVEQFQKADGTFEIPAVLKKYMY